MSPNDNSNDKSQYNRDSSEDNPFITFRRFTDSQVSSLLNSVSTLFPITLNPFQVYQAHEQCLFGEADPEKCEKLRELQNEVARIRSQPLELRSISDCRLVLERAENMMKLELEADELRKMILEDSKWRDTSESDNRGQMELVERVGKEKGQHWGWSWSWGFPATFGEEEREKSFEDWSSQRDFRDRFRRRAGEDTTEQAEEEWQHRTDRWECLKRKMNKDRPCAENSEPRERMWPFSWPAPPTDSPRATKSSNERILTIFDELGNIVKDEFNKILPNSFSYDNEAYSPHALEKNEELRRTGISWRDAYEDLVRSGGGAPLTPSERVGKSESMTQDRWGHCFKGPNRRAPENAYPSVPRAKAPEDHWLQPSRQYPKLVPWEGEETSEEPSYEYAHDHEDQHDDPPTPKMVQGKFPTGASATELEAYERLLGPTNTSPEPANSAPMSVLSTLTTTERTIAPDGTTTTKVVLKKRFADGREESSETVHTQRGLETETLQDPWKTIQETQSSKQLNPSQQPDKKNEGKKTGWFWSN